jgi:MFS family permease
MFNVGVPRQLVVVVVPLALVIMGDSLMYVVLPTRFAEFGIGNTLGISAGFWVGLALSVNRFVRLISNTFAARVYERAGLRTPFVSAVLLGGLTTLAYALSSGILVLLIARLLWGVSYSFMRLASQIVVFRFGSDRERGKYLGFYNMGQRTGSIIAVTGGAVMATRLGGQEAFAVLAGVGALGVAIALLAPRIDVPSLSGDKRSTSKTTLRSRVTPVNILAPHSLSHSVKRYVASLSLMRFSIAFAANGLAIATVSPYLAELLADGRTVFGASIAALTLGGMLVGTRWFGDLALSIPSGTVSDRVGRVPIIVGGIAVMVAVLLFVGIIDSPELFLLLMPLMFFASIFANTSLDATLGESVSSQERAPAFARYSTWQDLGGALGPLLGLTLAEIIGFRGGYLLAAAMLGASLAVLAITYKLPRNDPAAATP